MPYINGRDREQYQTMLDYAEDNGINSKGDLEYLICSLMDIYMENREFKYSDLHDCCYAAQHSADEFRRRFLDKREDQACKANGEVFTRTLSRI